MRLKLEKDIVLTLPAGTILDVTDVGVVQPPSSVSGLFSPTSFWNTKLLNQAVAPQSATFVKELVRNWGLAGPWINTSQWSTPLYIADASTPQLPITIVGKPATNLYKECQLGIPIPVGAIPASGTDGHCTIWDKSADILYEFWQLKLVGGKWEASWGGIIKNVSTSDGIVPMVINSAGGKEYQGATATSLPAIGGTMLLSELKEGVIPHALACAIPEPSTSFVWPALRSDGFKSGGVREGQRFTFPSNITIDSNWFPIIKMMVTAIRDYGLVVRDKAGAFVLYGEDPTQYKLPNDPYVQYYGGKQLWDVMKQFPIGQLVAI